MISQANIDWISKLSGVSVEDISGALTNSEKVTLDFKLNGRVVSQEEERLIKENSVKQGKEIGYKDIAKGLELTLDAGEKDPLKIAEKLKSSITLSLEEKYKNTNPSDKEKELEEKHKAEQLKYTKLLETHEGTLGKIQEKEKAFTGLQKEIKTKERNNLILKSFPEKMKQDKADALIIFNSTFDIDEVEGKQVVKRAGEIITNSLGMPDTIENIVPSYVEEKKWLKNSGMNGGDRTGADGFKGGKTPEEATKIIKEKYGDNFTSSEAMTEFIELTADKQK